MLNNYCIIISPSTTVYCTVDLNMSTIDDDIFVELTMGVRPPVLRHGDNADDAGQVVKVEDDGQVKSTST